MLLGDNKTAAPHSFFVLFPAPHTALLTHLSFQVNASILVETGGSCEPKEECSVSDPKPFKMLYAA